MKERRYYAKRQVPLCGSAKKIRRLGPLLPQVQQVRIELSGSGLSRYSILLVTRICRCTIMPNARGKQLTPIWKPQLDFNEENLIW
jgi:hypothetical protein